MKIIESSEALNRIAKNSPYYHYEKINNDNDNEQFVSKVQSRYALFLGAGASIESKIMSANSMIEYFASAICDINCSPVFNDNHENRIKWLKENRYFNSEIDLYSSLFEKCFPKKYERRDFIEKQVEGKIPSLGYIALAHLLKKHTFDTIITTNFDDLIYLACTHFTDIRPVVFALGGFASEITSVVNRPRVLKIHGDYLFQNVKNTINELKHQDPNMKQQVEEILLKYDGLVVLGYAGNDSSVLEVFEKLPKNEEKNLFWCVYKNGSVNKRVEKLLDSKGRYLVRTDGFDKFMLDLAKIEGIRFAHLIKSLLERNELIIDEFINFNLDLNNSEYLHEKNTISRQHNKLQNALKVMQLLTLGNRCFEKKEYEEAEKFYGNAKKLKENEADAHYNYAKVISLNLMKSHIAIYYFEKALKLNPDDAYTRNRYANMLVKLRRFNEAEKLYREAMEKAEKYIYPIIGLGDICLLKGDFTQAEKWYQKAKEMELNSKSCRFALAEILYKLSIILAKKGNKVESQNTLIEALPTDVGLLEYLINKALHYNKIKDKVNEKKSTT